MEEISLLELWDALRKNLGKILGLGVLTAVLTFAVSYFLIIPKYEATTTLIVGKPESYSSSGEGIQYNDVLLNQKLVSTYSEIMKSRGIADRVIQNLGLNFDLQRFQQALNVRTVNDTEIISVKVTDTIPERAMDIANETAEIFQEEVQSIMKVDNVQIIDAAILPEKPVSPRSAMNGAIGLVLGLMLGVFLALIKEFTDNTIKDADDLTNTFGLPVLGNIPKVKNGEAK